MSEHPPTADATPTLPFETFWQWVVTHANCILRAGTRDAAIYDDEDYHWHFGQEESDSLLVQVVRGKRLVGELLVPGDRIAYVQGGMGDHEGEFLFELITGDESEQVAAFFFVLTHGYEAQEETGQRRVH
jgi:hypothetical protein